MPFWMPFFRFLVENGHQSRSPWLHGFATFIKSGGFGTRQNFAENLASEKWSKKPKNPKKWSSPLFFFRPFGRVGTWFGTGTERARFELQDFAKPLPFFCFACASSLRCFRLFVYFCFRSFRFFVFFVSLIFVSSRFVYFRFCSFLSVLFFLFFVVSCVFVSFHAPFSFRFACHRSLFRNPMQNCYQKSTKNEAKIDQKWTKIDQKSLQNPPLKIDPWKKVGSKTLPGDCIFEKLVSILASLERFWAPFGVLGVPAGGSQNR